MSSCLLVVCQAVGKFMWKCPFTRQDTSMKIILAALHMWIGLLIHACGGQILKELETTFDQWTASPKARLLKDPASKRPMGHALVSLSNPRHAQYLETDISDMVFMYGGAPRPLQARVAIPGEHGQSPVSRTRRQAG